MSIMFEATKGGLKIAFAATMIREEAPKNGFFNTHNGRVHIAIERDSLLSALSNFDGRETVTLETTYAELMRYASEEKTKSSLGIINVDRFDPSFSF
jgi:hypothetical protein